MTSAGSAPATPSRPCGYLATYTEGQLLRRARDGFQLGRGLLGLGSAYGASVNLVAEFYDVCCAATGFSSGHADGGHLAVSITAPTDSPDDARRTANPCGPRRGRGHVAVAPVAPASPAPAPAAGPGDGWRGARRRSG